MNQNQEIENMERGIQQRLAINQDGFSGLSNTPYYIQLLESKIEALDYKLNLIIKRLDKE